MSAFEWFLAFWVTLWVLSLLYQLAEVLRGSR